MNPRTARAALGTRGNRFSALVLGVVAAAMSGGIGCDFLTVMDEGPGTRPNFVAVLIDETGSFAEDWDDMLRWVGTVAERMQPPGGLVVIGIDNEGFQSDDVRIGPLLLDPSPLRARVQVREVAKEIEALAPRPANPDQPYTDVLGALRHAAYFFALERYRDFDPVLLVFSDMRQTPRMPTAAEARDLSFPGGTVVHALYVDATGWEDWRQTVQLWQELLSNAGVSISAESFHQKAETSVEINRLFPRQF